MLQVLSRDQFGSGGARQQDRTDYQIRFHYGIEDIVLAIVANDMKDSSMEKEIIKEEGEKVSIIFYHGDTPLPIGDRDETITPVNNKVSVNSFFSIHISKMQKKC